MKEVARMQRLHGKKLVFPQFQTLPFTQVKCCFLYSFHSTVCKKQ